MFSVTALAAAAAGGGFISPLLGALVGPLQQQRRRMTKPDLQTHVCRCQLDQEQQASFDARRSSMYLTELQQKTVQQATPHLAELCSLQY